MMIDHSILRIQSAKKEFILRLMHRHFVIEETQIHNLSHIMINVEYVVEGQTDLLLTTTTATTSQKIDPRWWWWRQRHLYEIARCLWIDCTIVCRFSFCRALDACRIRNGLVFVFRIKTKGFFWIQDKKK